MNDGKPYKLFIFDQYEPYGGLSDLYDSYAAFDEAVDALMNLEVKHNMCECAHIGKDYEIIQAFSCTDKLGEWKKIN